MEPCVYAAPTELDRFGIRVLIKMARLRRWNRYFNRLSGKVCPLADRRLPALAMSSDGVVVVRCAVAAAFGVFGGVLSGLDGTFSMTDETFCNSDKTFSKTAKTLSVSGTTLSGTEKTRFIADKAIAIVGKTLPRPDKTLSIENKTLPDTDKTLSVENKTLPDTDKTLSVADKTPAKAPKVAATMEKAAFSPGEVPSTKQRVVFPSGTGLSSARLGNRTGERPSSQASPFTSQPATPTKWKYRAIYRLDDAQVGMWSGVREIVAG